MHNRGTDAGFSGMFYLLIIVVTSMPLLYLLKTWFISIVSVYRLLSSGVLAWRVNGFVSSACAYILSILPFVLIGLFFLGLYNDLAVLRLGFRVMFELWFK